jgi:hypothetical protein
VGVGAGEEAGYGKGSSLHHCVANLFYLRVPDANGDNGDDFAQNIGNMDVYDNTIISRPTTGFAGANHRDFFQMEAHYMRFWNNYFENAANYTIFGEYWVQRGTQNWQIWNNVFNYSDPVLTGNPTQAIAIGNCKGKATANIDYNNVFIFNNTFQGAQQAIAFGCAGMKQTLHNCRFQNNLRYNAGGINIHGTLVDGSVVSNNVAASTNWFGSIAAWAPRRSGDVRYLFIARGVGRFRPGRYPD